MNIKNISILFSFCFLLITSPLIQAAEKTIYGRLENIQLFPEDITVDSKLDTGAYRSSIHAQSIERFKKKDKQWVRFTFMNKKKKTIIERPLHRMTKVKNRIGEASTTEPGTVTRPVVMLTICLAGKLFDIETSLADRSNFSTSLLIGRKAMIANEMVIDPSLVHTGKPNCEKPAQQRGADS